MAKQMRKMRLPPPSLRPCALPSTLSAPFRHELHLCCSVDCRLPPPCQALGLLWCCSFVAFRAVSEGFLESDCLEVLVRAVAGQSRAEQRWSDHGVHFRASRRRLRAGGGRYVAGAEHRGAEDRRGQDHDPRQAQAARRHGRERRPVRFSFPHLLVLPCRLRFPPLPRPCASFLCAALGFV